MTSSRRISALQSATQITFHGLSFPFSLKSDVFTPYICSHSETLSTEYSTVTVHWSKSERYKLLKGRASHAAIQHGNMDVRT